jgi:hypothetical protein
MGQLICKRTSACRDVQCAELLKWFLHTYPYEILYGAKERHMFLKYVLSVPFQKDPLAYLKLLNPESTHIHYKCARDMFDDRMHPVCCVSRTEAGCGLRVYDIDSDVVMQKFVDIAIAIAPKVGDHIVIDLTECSGGLISGAVALAKIFGSPPIISACISKRGERDSMGHLSALWSRDENGMYVAHRWYPRQPPMKRACDVLVFCRGASSAAAQFVELAKLAGVECIGKTCDNDHLCTNGECFVSFPEYKKSYQMPSTAYKFWAIKDGKAR